MRISIAAAVACLSITTLSAGEYAAAAVRRETHILPQSLEGALRDFARDRNLQLVYATDEVSNRASGGASGNLSADETLTQLLKDTGLAHQFLDEKTVTVHARATAPSGVRTRPELTRQPSGSLRLAQSDERVAASEVAGSGNSEQASSVSLEEIVVSAQKRGDERLKDVPIPVAVLSAEKLASGGQLLLRDYYASIPALSVATNFNGQQRLAIRGISNNTGAGATNPTVGVLIDDVPIGAATTLTQGIDIPDIDPGDLSRIEVLRGPQGSLYGANSMGGLIRYVTKDPSPDRVSAQLGGGVSGTTNSGSGYNVRGNLNLPLSTSLAIRASAFVRQDPGYIDNPVFDLEDLNEAHAAGGRLSASWQLRDNVSLKLNAHYQRIRADGTSEVEVRPGLGDLQQSFIPGSGQFERSAQLYSVALNALLGEVRLSSITGYSRYHVHQFRDTGPTLTAAQRNYFSNVYQTIDAITVYDFNLEKFSQELRLEGDLGRRIQWQLGAFYSDENNPPLTQIFAGNVATGNDVGQFYDGSFYATFSEYAGFASLTYQMTDRFDVQVGGRYSWDKATLTKSIVEGPFTTVTLGQPSPAISPDQAARTGASTYLLTPRFRIGPDLMVYARIASGYRPGGPNDPSIATRFGLPAKFDPDKTQNYEVGIKADFLDHRLSIDGSVFHIDWKAIQLGVRTVQGAATVVYSTNGGSAKSEGAELTVTARPWRDMTIAASGAYDNAVISDPLPTGSTIFAVPGDRLPITPRISGSLSADQKFPLWSGALGSVGGTVSYVGDRLGYFPTSVAGTRQALPEYTKLDLRIGAEFGSWMATMFATNVTDERGLINGGAGYNQPNTFVYIPPRLIGVNVTRTF